MLVRGNGDNRDDYWANRGDSLDLLRPNRQAANSFAVGSLRKILSNGNERAIDVLIDRGPEFKLGDPNAWDEWSFEEVVRFIAFVDTTGEVQFKAVKGGIVHAGIGKASFDEAKLVENVRAFVTAVNKAKPAGAKGTYMKKISLTSTMGPGVSIDVGDAATLADA